MSADGDRWLPSLTDALNRPQPAWLCVLGWCAATGIFLALVAAFAGPSRIDIGESEYSTWAIAHGQIACAYPSVSLFEAPPVAPVYPLLSGGIAAITRLGHSAPFPSAATLGPECDKAFSAMNRWAKQTGVVVPTTWVGCVTWLALMAGVIAWLRRVGPGTLRLGAGHPHVRRRPAAGVDVRAELLSPTRPARHGPRAVRHGMRLPRTLAGGRSALRPGHSLSAVRAPGRRAPVRARTGEQEALLCGGGSADRSDRGHPSGGHDVRVRPALHRARNGEQPRRGWDGSLGDACQRRGGRAALSSGACRGLGCAVVVGHATPRSWRSPARGGPLSRGGLARPAARLRGKLLPLLLHGPGGDLGVARGDPGVHSADRGCVAGRVDPGDLSPFPSALRRRGVGGVPAERPHSAPQRPCLLGVVIQLVRGGNRRNLGRGSPSRRSISSPCGLSTTNSVPGISSGSGKWFSSFPGSSSRPSPCSPESGNLARRDHKVSSPRLLPQAERRARHGRASSPRLPVGRSPWDRCAGAMILREGTPTVDGGREPKVKSEHGQRRGQSIATAGFVIGPLSCSAPSPPVVHPRPPLGFDVHLHLNIDDDLDLPVVRHFRQGSAAELAACQSDAKTLETALEAYMAENGAYPSPPHRGAPPLRGQLRAAHVRRRRRPVTCRPRRARSST